MKHGPLLAVLLLLLTACTPTTTIRQQPVATESIYTLYAHQPGVSFKCTAVATTVGVLTADHCTEGERTLELVDTRGHTHPIHLKAVHGHIAILTTPAGSQPLPLATMAQQEEVHAHTHQGWQYGQVTSYPPGNPTFASSRNITIQPGDSGAPVLNKRGHVIGISLGLTHFGTAAMAPTHTLTSTSLANHH